jgi:hypothetical protein
MHCLFPVLTFSIISLLDEAGPKVATCLVDLRQRCATMGAVAIDVCLGRGVAGVICTPLGAMMLENRALSRVERPNEGDVKPGTNAVVVTAKLAVTRIWYFMVKSDISIGTCVSLHS